MKLSKALWNCILIFLLIIPLASALTTYEETSSVSRIVGESPTEMLRQMQRGSLNINHATFYGHDYEQSYNDKKSILNEEFSNNKYIKGSQWDVRDFEAKINGFGKNELFIAETSGDVDPLYAKSQPAQLFQGKLYPNDLRAWQPSFESNNPLMLWDSPYAGSYLPKEDTFVSRLVRDSTVIAPTSFNSPQFTRSFLCQLAGDKTIGQVFKDARNFHYDGGSKSSGNNLIGLVLQSYALYGNPRQVISMKWSKEDQEKIKKYCSYFLENLAPDIEFLEQIGNYSKFRKHMIFKISDYNIAQVGNFSIVNATNTFQNQEYGELVLPIAVRTTHFPLNTLITNFSLDYAGDFEDIVVNDLPSYESDFVNRTCYEENKSYEVNFENAYAESSLDFIARISPVSVINCTEGTFRLYKKFNYSVDYIALSPVLIKSIDAPILSQANGVINVSIELMPLTNVVVNGSLAIFDENNNKLWEKETATNIADFNASFFAQNEEGLKRYSVEFMQGNETLTYGEFSLFVILLEPIAGIPVSVNESPNVEISLYSYLNDSFDLQAKYYLLHEDNIMHEGEFLKTINDGNNTHTLSFNGLKKENQSYTLTMELNYLGNKKTLSYLLNTNNAPIIYYSTQQEFTEGEEAAINYAVIDYDGDNLTVSVNDSRFNQSDNVFEWQTGYDDAGIYDVLVSASDGLLSDSHIVTIKVNNVNRAPNVEPIPNITVNEAELAIINVSASDPDNDTLAYSINDSKFSQNNSVFSWRTAISDAGEYDVIVTASDGLLENSRVVRITVLETANHAPEIHNFTNITAYEEDVIVMTINATDEDGDQLEYSVNDTHFEQEENVFTWYTDFGDSGTYALLANVSDGKASTLQTVNVTIIDVPEPMLNISIDGIINIPGSFFSPYYVLTMNEGDTRRFSVILTNVDRWVMPFAFKWELNRTLVSSSDELNFTPDYNSSGEYPLTVNVRDSRIESRGLFGIMNIIVIDTMDCEPDTRRLCAFQEGVCRDSFEVCTGGNWTGCSESNYKAHNSSYEAVETSCDTLDNDCDGKVDEGQVCLLTKPSPCGTYGDVNSDGGLNESDAELIANSLAKLVNLTPEQKGMADVNGDGSITIVDSLFIAQYASGVRDTFPVCYLKYSPCFPYGDVDLDGFVSGNDARLLASYIAGKAALSDEQKSRADVNKDGNVSVVDSLFIAQFVEGVKETFQACG